MSMRILAAALAVISAVPAAANLVANGDFATNDFAGWTQFGNTNYTGINSGVAEFGPDGTSGGIRQTLATVAGTTYTIGFDLENDGGTPSLVNVDFGASSLLSLANADYFPFVRYSFSLLATGNDVLSFEFREDPSYFRLDNVVVEVKAPTAELVTNGSFETGSFSGWTQFGDTGFTLVRPGDYVCCSPSDGDFQAIFGPEGVGGIGQAIGVAERKYVVSFDLGNDQGESSFVNFGGVTLLNGVPSADGLVHYRYVVTALDNSGLKFGFANPVSFYNLDNVSVTAAVPEPAAWALLIAGFGLTGATLRRRRFSRAALR